jgi:DNA-binding MarR family transcriptional regulator
MQQARRTHQAAVPDDLESPRAKLVYLYLSTHDGATVSELQDGLSMKKITLFSILKTLRGRGLVGQDRDQYVVAS